MEVRRRNKGKSNDARQTTQEICNNEDHDPDALDTSDDLKHEVRFV